MYFNSKIRCGNCGKYRTVRGAVALHKTRGAFELFLRENGVSPCPCRLNLKPHPFMILENR